MPFRSFELSAPDRRRLQEGTVTLLKQCLTRYDITATFAGDYIQQVNDPEGEPYVYPWGGMLGTLTLDQAQQHGYSSPPGGSWANGNGIYLPSPLQLYPVPPTDPTEAARLDAALFGPDDAIIALGNGDSRDLPPELTPQDGAGNFPPATGCAGLVEKNIDVPLADLRDLETDAYVLTFGHNAVAAVAAEWSACMGKSGYEFKTFADALTDNAGAPTSERIAVATTDVQCTASTEWPKIFYPILADYEQQIIDRQPELFSSALEAERNRLERIDSLLEG